ncbi:hypothetical protein LCGC14_2831030, partial [marine sediment metagenome]
EEKSPIFLPYKNNPAIHRFRFHQMDMNRDMDSLIELLTDYQPSYIVNFAAQSEVGPSWDTPWEWFETNTVSLSRLVNAMKDMDFIERYVHISSPEVYGTCEGVVLEDHIMNPSTPYAASKAAADSLLLTYVKNFSFPMSMVRSTNVYGAHQQLFKIIPRSVIYIKSGRVIELHGGGHAVKSYIHIRDISRGELDIMLRGGMGETYHLSSESGVAVRDVVRTLCENMGVLFEDATREVKERLGQDAAYVIDSSKARKEFGWTTSVTLEDGLSKVIEWVENNWDEISSHPLHYVHKP